MLKPNYLRLYGKWLLVYFTFIAIITVNYSYSQTKNTSHCDPTVREVNNIFTSKISDSIKIIDLSKLHDSIIMRNSSIANKFINFYRNNKYHKQERYIDYLEHEAELNALRHRSERWWVYTTAISVVCLLLLVLVFILKKNQKQKVKQIEKQEQIQLDLSKTNANFQAILNSTKQIFVLLDNQYKIQSYNQNAYDVFLKILGKSLKHNDFALDYFSENQVANVREILKKVSSGEIIEIEKCVQCEGKMLCYKIKYIPVVLDDLTIGITINAEDITTIKESELANIEYANQLKKSEEKYRNIFENIQNVYYEINLEGIILEVNTIVEQYTLYTRNELIGHQISDLYVDKNLRAYIIEQLLLNQRITDLEAQFYNKNGEILYCSITACLLKDVDGNPLKIVGSLLDISNRKRAERALNESRENFKELLENVGDGVSFVDKDENIVFFNQVANQIFGIDDLNQNNLNIRDFVSESNFQKVNDETQQRKLGLKSTYQLEIIRPSGEVRQILLNATPKFNADGSFSGSFGIFRDITELKNTEIALQKSETRYREIVDNANDIIFTMDFDGNFKSINPIAEKVFGYTLQELNELNMGKYISPESIRNAKIQIKDNLKSLEEHSKYEVKAFTKLNKSKILEVNSYLRYINNKPSEILGIARDITLRKETEEALKFSEEKYRRLFENAPLGIISVRPNGEVQEYNAPFIKLMGSDIFQGAEIYNVLNYPVFVCCGISEKINNCFIKGQNSNSEHQIIGKNGKPVYIRMNLKAIKNSWNLVSLVQAVFEDISNQKNTEQKIKQSLLEKETLIKEIHHRVKNNLQVIMSLVNMTIEPKMSKVITEKFIDIRERVRTLSMIHEDLYVSQNFTNIRIKHFIEKLSNSLIQLYDEGFNIDCELNIEDVYLDIDSAIPCGLVLNELLSNSIKYAFNKSKNNKSRNLIQISLSQPAHDFHLIVKDNGKGLPPDFNIENADSLGFQLVNLLVTSQLNGSIQVSTNKGSTFDILFPKK